MYRLKATLEDYLRLAVITAYSCRTMGIRHPVPNAREVTFRTGAACLNSAMRTSRNTRRRNYRRTFGGLLGATLRERNGAGGAPQSGGRLWLFRQFPLSIQGLPSS